MPATSGPHWGTTPTNWGVYSTPQPESQVIHNLEHGGIVIWYDADAVTDAEVDEMASYVEGQVATGLGGRFKFILSPWPDNEDLGAVVAVTAWRHLKLDTVDMDAIRTFADGTPEVGAGAERRAGRLRPASVDPPARLRHHSGGRLAQRQSK